VKRIIGIAILALLGASQVSARDAFDKVRCDGDIVKALIGQRDSDDTVVKTEERHKDIGLKDLGASDDNGFSSITWSICRKEYVVLENDKTNVVHDALQIPPHSPSHPAFEGVCKLNGKLMSDSVVGVVTERSGAEGLAAETAWRIDEKTVRFVRQPTDGLLCPRYGVEGWRSR
jgi:hypothetical protein